MSTGTNSIFTETSAVTLPEWDQSLSKRLGINCLVIDPQTNKPLKDPLSHNIPDPIKVNPGKRITGDDMHEEDQEEYNQAMLKAAAEVEKGILERRELPKEQLKATIEARQLENKELLAKMEKEEVRTAVRTEPAVIAKPEATVRYVLRTMAGNYKGKCIEAVESEGALTLVFDIEADTYEPLNNPDALITVEVNDKKYKGVYLGIAPVLKALNVQLQVFILES